jgi:hypothetical protein
MLPALALSAFGLGVAERDGVVGLFGGVMAMVSIVVLAVLSKALIAGFTAFVITLMRMF